MKNNIILPLILLCSLLSLHLADTHVISSFISAFLFRSLHLSIYPLDILYILSVLVVFGTRAN